MNLFELTEFGFIAGTMLGAILTLLDNLRKYLKLEKNTKKLNHEN